MTEAPVVDRRIVEALLEVELERKPEHRLVLVHGRYEQGASERFSMRIDGRERRISVTDQPSVLGVADAWLRHRTAEDAEDGDTLVVTTTAPPAQLGLDLCAHALRRTTLTVSLEEIVRRRFGAAQIDPRIRRNTWLVEALLAAEPAVGWRAAAATADWRRSGGRLLSLDAAVRVLIEERMGRVFDLDALLAWSRTALFPGEFAKLSADEREGITAWLRGHVGDAAVIVLSLAEQGRASDAMALGVVSAVLTDARAAPEAALAVGGLFGAAAPSVTDLKTFSSAVQGTLTRWIGEAASGRGGAGDRVKAVVDRADELAEQAGIRDALADNPYLPSGMRVRLQQLAHALGGNSDCAETALRHLADHRLADLNADRLTTARMAVRLRRWLDDATEPLVTSVSVGVREHLASWGWVDRALAVLWDGDQDSDPIVAGAYRLLFTEAQARRNLLDEAFAGRLTAWAAHATSVEPGGCLLIEDVLTKVVLPLGAVRAPLVLVLDGMSAAVAAELGEELYRGGWKEVSATGARRAAVAMIPSLTTLSRASLLSGTPTSGGQKAESDGFAAYFRTHRREALLFHKADIAGGAGQRLAQPLHDAIAGEAVVAVVLNTIDEALDHGRARWQWSVSDIGHLAELAGAARGAGRPLVLVSDHGHVLERSENAPAPGGTGAARWRIGSPAQGEVSVSGPRVLEGGGTVTVPWREDLRYTSRKSGYHGGASLAEMTVPVLTFVPSMDVAPPAVRELAPETVTPSWWQGGAAAVVEAPVRLAAPDSGALLDIVQSLGSQVVASERFREQKRHVRRAPDNAQVITVIDALVSADGHRLSPAAVAAAAGGRASRDAIPFVTVLERLLNVEGYPVLGLIDGGRTVRLDVALLREQFGL
ncbi:PglZ domain-containing protein [Actinocorallia herbida]|uniref:PglZ domain-containing protein n=1 Tax=Actinocorallia herbida TaxID=58109 RepID=A0A3N1CNZ8_9ACTN|nr:BREX-2 system phosphatase PglZ [Actinocorallia herbida]ROO83040.1 PglZ domain-containing protein [Actinocorallia herbida]